MKSLKSLLLLFALFIVAMPAFAAATIMTPLAAAAVTPHDPSPEDMSVSQKLTYDIARMDDSEKAEALKRIEAPESSPTDTAKKAQEWIDIGNGIGTGLATTAEKLGIAVNKFAESPVGKMAMVLIIWNYMGHDISGYICGILWMAFLLPIWTRNFRRTFGVYNEKGKFVRLNSEMFSDRAQYGTIAWVYIIGFVLIAFVFLVFIA